jgi:hypothetical protein
MRHDQTNKDEKLQHGGAQASLALHDRETRKNKSNKKSVFGGENSYG